jgi:hypothetical protein
MDSPMEYEVILKQHGRAIQRQIKQDAGQADAVAREWYAQGDGRTYEVKRRERVAEQVEPQIESDRYLTQETRPGHEWLPICGTRNP